MARSTVSRNEASAPGGQALGGGIRVEGGPSSSIRNSTVSANRVTGDTTRGGGIDSFASVLNVVNATVARNSATLGGGLYKETGTTNLEATILAANTATTGPNCGGGTVESAGHNLISRRAGCTITPLPSDIVNKGAKLGGVGEARRPDRDDRAPFGEPGDQRHFVGPVRRRQGSARRQAAAEQPLRHRRLRGQASRERAAEAALAWIAFA